MEVIVHPPERRDGRSRGVYACCSSSCCCCCCLHTLGGVAGAVAGSFPRRDPATGQPERSAAPIYWAALTASCAAFAVLVAPLAGEGDLEVGALVGAIGAVLLLPVLQLWASAVCAIAFLFMDKGKAPWKSLRRITLWSFIGGAVGAAALVAILSALVAGGQS